MAGILLSASVAAGQAVTFQYASSATTTPVTLTAGATIDFPPVAPPGSSSVTLLVAFQGPNPLNLTGMTASGTGFSVVAFSPTTIQSGSSVSYTLLFTASAGGVVNGRLDVLAMSGDAPYAYTFGLRANFTAPKFALSYILNPNGNQVAVTGGQTLSFPATTVTQTASATFVVANTGTASGSLNAASVGSAAFVLSGLPLLPDQILPAQEVRFTITFTPTVRGSCADALTLNLTTGTQQIVLGGQGLAGVLRFEFKAGASSTVVTSGAQLDLGSAQVGASSTAIMTLTNTGDADSRVSTITLSGASFRLPDVPALPLTLSPQQSANFSIAFTSSAPGTAQGQLRIDTNSFSLTAVGLGPQFAFFAVFPDTSLPLTDNGVISFPNATLGGKSSVALTISNTGTASGTVGSIAVQGAGFSIPSYPALPATLQANGTLTVTLVFAPASVGPLTGTLQVDQHAFVLRGNGGAPAPLPAVVYADAPATTDALQQLSVSLHLSQPYPLDLKGNLILTFTPGSVADDPAIQFAGGGRSVSFSIPANTTDALFGLSATKVQFQTGSVAGVVTFTASFSIGQTDVTPSTPPATTVVLPAGPPQIRGVQIGTTTASSFELLISGYSTTRSLTGLHLDFAPASGATLQNTSMDVNAQSSFDAWYQSTASVAYGSQFTASLLINFNGSINDIQSVSVRATNLQGQSGAVVVALR
jgi:hypothetical protein